MDVWAEVAAGRHALADLVDGLEPGALERPSWCDGWRGRDVLGHLVYLAEATRLSATRDVLRHGPRPDKALDHTARRMAERPVEELTRRLRAGADGRFHITGSPPAVALGELLVHGSDLLRPAGVDTDLTRDPAHAVEVLRIYRRIGRLAFHGSPTRGVTLVAVDADVRVGKGPEVRGRAIDLLLLAANRLQVVDRLSGPGVATLSR